MLSKPTRSTVRTLRGPASEPARLGEKPLGEQECGVPDAGEHRLAVFGQPRKLVDVVGGFLGLADRDAAEEQGDELVAERPVAAREGDQLVRARHRVLLARFKVACAGVLVLLGLEAANEEEETVDNARTRGQLVPGCGG